MKTLISSDFHFRSNKPIARVDDYRETQHKEIMWLKELREKGSVESEVSKHLRDI